MKKPLGNEIGYINEENILVEKMYGILLLIGQASMGSSCVMFCLTKNPRPLVVQRLDSDPASCCCTKADILKKKFQREFFLAKTQG